MATIQLTQGKSTTVDDADYEWLSQWKWYFQAHRDGGYALRNGARIGTQRQQKIRLHRVITNAFSGDQVDHINGDTLDNRRSNLRVTTHTQNAQNSRKPRRTLTSSRFKGVASHRGVRWQASITVDGRPIYLGLFASEVDAARAYNAAARDYFGEYARLNHIEETP